MDYLEPILEPGDWRRSELESPLSVAAGVRTLAIGQRQVGAQPHRGVPLVGIGEAEEHGVIMARPAPAPPQSARTVRVTIFVLVDSTRSSSLSWRITASTASVAPTANW
jgi:hypothetical protein